MNCNYCGSRVFYDEKCCSQCGAPIYQGNGIVENERKFISICAMPTEIHFDKNKAEKANISVIGLRGNGYANKYLRYSCDYKILGKTYGITINDNVIYKPKDTTPYPCSVVIIVSHKDNELLNDHILIEID